MLFKEVAPSIVKLVLVQDNLVTEGAGFVVRNQSSGELVIVTANHVAKCNETSKPYLGTRFSTTQTTSLPRARRTSFYRPSITIRNSAFLFSPSLCKTITASCAYLMALPLSTPRTFA